MASAARLAAHRARNAALLGNLSPASVDDLCVIVEALDLLGGRAANLWRNAEAPKQRWLTHQWPALAHLLKACTDSPHLADEAGRIDYGAQETPTERTPNP